MQLQENIDQFEGLNADFYAISVDSPAAHKELKEEGNLSYSFLSDPTQMVIDDLTDMSNGEVSHRGFSILNENGELVTSHVNDFWGEQIDQTEQQIREALEE